ncbi:MAG: antibiotic biosynthesis monooxygenase [Gammaproteobacteria bacterium]|nr:antibiotic biosynthesis monooxygenase [Gammaproteobacteria bacterium]
MSVGVVARLKIKEGTNEDFEKVFSDLAQAVRENETGNNFYALHRSRDDNTTYIVLEQYADQAALEAHGQSDHFKTIGAKMGPYLAGRPEVEYMDAV